MKAGVYINDLEFKHWEKALVLLSVLLFSLSFYLYVTDYPLKRYLFNIEDEGVHRQVGWVSIKDGALRRQVQGEAEFKSLEVQSSLFDEDTVVTGLDATATLQLEDGSTIELAQGTMVKLHFDNSLTLGGISRAASIDVVAGKVKTQSKTPRAAVRIKPKPKPVELPRAPVKVVAVPQPVVVPSPIIVAAEPEGVKYLELTSPRPGTAFSLEPNSKVLEKIIGLNWRISPSATPGRKLLLSLRRLKPGSDGTVTSEEIQRQLVTDINGAGQAQVTLKAPGSYEWELLTDKGLRIQGAKSARSNFQLQPEFDAIETLVPLVGGEAQTSSRMSRQQLKNFDITLRWKPYQAKFQPKPQDKYRISIKTTVDAKVPVLDKKVSSPQYRFNKDKVFAGQIFYQVFAPLPGGFIARSPVKPFVFSFLAPALVVPVNHSVLSKAKLLKEGDGTLLTWQKTNFTDFYELEISKDPNFESWVQKLKLKENFFIFKSPPQGKYYWRVRSYAKSVLSPPSPAFDLTITP